MKLFLYAVILPFTQYKQCDKNTTALRQHRSYYTTEPKYFWWDIFSFDIYRTRAIITRGLYSFYPIFHCGLYLRAVYTAERLVITWLFFHLRSPEKKWHWLKTIKKKERLFFPCFVHPTPFVVCVCVFASLAANNSYQ